MDLQVGGVRLPCPQNIMISNTRTSFRFVLTWDAVLNPDYGKAKSSGGTAIQKVGYHVYRGTSVEGIFYRLTTTPSVDTRLEVQVGKNPNTNYMYKVSTVAIYTDGSQTEGPLSDAITFFVPNTNKWFKKINERNRWILKNDAVLMDLYVRKTDGQRCKCYNPEYGQGDENCPICFGTTYEGGYEPVYQMYVREKPAFQALEMQNQGFVINKSTTAWTISKTIIKNRDVLINRQGVIYSVLRSYINSSAGYYFHQEFEIKEVDPTDILYSLQRKTLTPEY